MTVTRHTHNCLSRREFLTRSAQFVVAGSAAALFPISAGCTPLNENKNPEKTSKASTVVRRHDDKVFDRNRLNDRRVQQLVDRAVCALLDVRDPKEAFRALFSPTDVVALKPNCLAGPGMSTSPAVVNAIVSNLRAIGIPFSNIIIFERTTDELVRVGFTANRFKSDLPVCLGNDEAGFENELSFSGEVGSLFSRVLSRRATALINIPVLKDHDLSGVGCGMKNMYGAIHNPNRYHDNNCDPFVADLSAHPLIAEKLKLVLVDALTAQYHGGPARVATHQWRAGEILAAIDPVALDTVAHGMIEEQRARHGLATLAESKRPPKWLKTAAERGLGETRPERIRVDRNQTKSS